MASLEQELNDAMALDVEPIIEQVVLPLLGGQKAAILRLAREVDKHRAAIAEFHADPSAMVIWTLEKLGLAKNVVRIAPEREAQKLVGAADREATDARAVA